MSDTDWASFEARLRTFVRRRVDPVWVDDVVGSILLRLVQNSDALQTARNPLAYVLRVASNAVTDHYRRAAVEKKTLAEFKNSDGLEGDAEAESGDATAELARCVLPFIHSLPESYREALVLTEIEGVTQAEAARRLGLSVSGMKSRVQRGRERLKRALLDCCAMEFDRRGGLVDYTRKSAGCGKSC